MASKNISKFVRTREAVIPMIYAYTTPNDHSHDGWTKIGYTEKQTVEDRIQQQTHTSDTATKLEWKGLAVYDDGSGEVFSDHDFRGYLYKLGYEKKPQTEFVKISPKEAQSKFYEFKQNRGVLEAIGTAIPYDLREEQEKAVSDTIKYFNAHENGSYLWNAKPRFGKTLSVYDFCKRINARNVLILTNRPAIADSWYNDYVKFV